MQSGLLDTIRVPIFGGYSIPFQVLWSPTGPRAQCHRADRGT